MTLASSVRRGTPTLLFVVAMVAMVVAVAVEVADRSDGQSPAAMLLIRQVRAKLGVY
jgi:hypothetical protein